MINNVVFTKMMLRILFTLLILLQGAVITYAQDDMYGDEQPNKSKKPKSTKTPAPTQQNNRPTSSPTNNSQNSQTPPMPAGTPSSVVYLMRPVQNFYGNNGTFQIKFNGVIVTELKTGSRVAFTMYTEGTLKVLCQYKTSSSTEFYKTITLDIKKGGSYYIMLSYLFDQTKQLDVDNGGRLWKDEQQFKTVPLNLYESPSAPLTIKAVDPPPVTTPTTTTTSTTSTNITAGQPYYTNGMLLGGGYIAVPLSTVEKGTKWIIITDDGIRLNAKLISSDKGNNLGVLRVTDSLYRDPGCSVFTQKIPATGDTMTCLYKEYKNGIAQLVTMKVLVKQPVIAGGSPFVYSMNTTLPSSVHSGIILDRFGKISGLCMPDNAGLVQTALKHQYVRTYGESLGASSPSCSGTESSDPLGNNTARVILIEVSK